MPYSVATPGDSSVLSLYCLVVGSRKEGKKKKEGEREQVEKRAPADQEEEKTPPPLSSKKKKKTHGLDLGSVFRGQLVDQRRNHPAGPAPGRPEVDEHGHGGLEDVLLPGGVGDGAWCGGDWNLEKREGRESVSEKKGKKEGKSRTPDLSLSLLSYLESKLFRALFTRVPSSTVGAE